MAFDQSGMTSFPVDGSPRDFNFTVTAADEKLKILLEDLVTKEQWHTSELEVSDFVTNQTAIPQAKVAQYAARVVHSLAPEDDADKPTRSLSRPSADDLRVLCIGFTLQAAAFTIVLEYSFTLSAVPLEATELLKARMRDVELMVMAIKTEHDERHSKTSPPIIRELEENIGVLKAENEQLRREVAELKQVTKAQGEKAFAEFSGQVGTSPEQAIVWTLTGDIDAIDAAQFLANSAGDILIVQGGVYTIVVSVLHNASSGSNAALFEVMLDGKTVRSMKDYYNQTSMQSTLTIRTKIPAGSIVRVVNRCDHNALPGSTITLIQDGAPVCAEQTESEPSKGSDATYDGTIEG